MFALGFAAGREVACRFAQARTLVEQGRLADARALVHARWLVALASDGEAIERPSGADMEDELEALAAAARLGHQAVAVQLDAGEVQLTIGDPADESGSATSLAMYFNVTSDRIATSHLVDQYPLFDFAPLIEGYVAAFEAADSAIDYGVLQDPAVQLIIGDQPLRLFDTIRTVARSEMRRTVRDLLAEGGVFITVPPGAPGLVVPPEARPNDGVLDIPIDEIVTLGDQSISAMCRVDDGPASLCVIPWSAIRGAWRAVPSPNVPDFIAFEETP